MVLSEEQAAAVEQELEKMAEERAEREDRNAPPPPTIHQKTLAAIEAGERDLATLRRRYRDLGTYAGLPVLTALQSKTMQVRQLKEQADAVAPGKAFTTWRPPVTTAPNGRR